VWLRDKLNLLGSFPGGSHRVVAVDKHNRISAIGNRPLRECFVQGEHHYPRTCCLYADDELRVQSFQILANKHSIDSGCVKESQQIDDFKAPSLNIDADAGVAQCRDEFGFP
jgi:hypothetical protein